MLNSKIILKIFSDFLDNTVSVSDSESEDRTLNLVRSSIETNQKQWKLEDLARKKELGPEHVAKTKQEIDKSNQIRNDLIREIDIAITNHMRVVQLDSIEQFCSESPGMIVDRFAILYIKLSVIRKLLAVIQEKDLIKEYKEKEKIILKQISLLSSFLDLYFDKLKHGKIFFEIQQPVKLYNDKRIEKYIGVLDQRTRNDSPNAHLG
ncbi:MAG: hypothetical protein UW81_C0031G0008 [Candidatus Giovannonibacteria bacterium GW2011_GWC2_44_9]|uniref:Uncharacterized protein n=2 Tax=Candidatus Giovannoniibacteriota TaxID=1752738 RepID=A0A0G1ISU0_9BACT|nr:MAG: hypothetical protein UW57_C0016G0009 [Candidatus Giovannonibacteria bacterium GW2011_GWA1_44_29]KKT82924.1 MAG: hypothetical protein UW81_C0031G0008 [Candidatus Giovannonibacteria bacterium GW2011_GWC2_44_9]KKT90818.1 MAG: hypothetical protein UW93_C0020G0008 [Parcubacteria group bacterium GW2011_GWC1_45_13]